MASELKPWKYEIKYGPEGEDAYSWVYDDHGAMVATMKTHKAKEIVDRMNTPVAPVSPDITGKCGELVTVLWGNARSLSQPHDPVVWERVCASYPRPYYTVELVTRSQAEELLAEEREKVLFLKTAMEIAQTHCGLKDKTIDSLEAKLAAAELALKRADEALQLDATASGHTYVKIALSEVRS